MRRNNVLPGIISIAVFILLEIASLYLLRHSSAVQNTWMGNASSGVKGALWGGTERAKDFFALKQTNESLAYENFLLQQEIVRLNELLASAHVDTMKLHRSKGFSMIPAQVVKMSRGGQHNYIILDRGYEDGIKEKSGIITRQGVIGIVDAVSAHTAYALSFQNADISISARLGNEGAGGLLVWNGKSSHGAILKEIPLQFKYNPGDTIYTSGHSMIFPPDIPLGTAGESRIVNGTTRDIDITLFQDFKAIRYVTVVHNNSFDEVEEFGR